MPVLSVAEGPPIHGRGSPLCFRIWIYGEWTSDPEWGVLMSPGEQITQLEAAIAHLEAQRSALGDAVVETGLAPLR